MGQAQPSVQPTHDLKRQILARDLTASTASLQHSQQLSAVRLGLGRLVCQAVDGCRVTDHGGPYRDGHPFNSDLLFAKYDSICLKWHSVSAYCPKCLGCTARNACHWLLQCVLSFQGNTQHVKGKAGVPFDDGLQQTRVVLLQGLRARLTQSM
jgi:hypothetical protein